MQWSEQIGRRLKLHDLRVLMAAAEAGSLSRAAKLLNTTQPAVSRSIRELERTLGARLFDRGAQGVEPTPHGRALLDGGAAVFDDLRQALKNIELLSDPSAGEVRIGSNPVLASTFVSAVVCHLAQRHPRLTVKLAASPVETLARQLVERQVEILITRKSDAIADGRFAFDFLFDDDFVIAAGSRNPWTRRRQVILADLVNEPWVLPPPESVIGTVTRDAFREAGLAPPRITTVAIPLEVRIALLVNGPFFTVFPRSAFKFHMRQEIKALPVRLAVAPVTNGIVTLKKRTLSSVASLFVQRAHELAKASK